ncbi:MAG: hypothetical protein GXX85_11225 [Ignavibacteria bacterium]|nr:hypothetical protein [Ignavibacteria bacterium]
MINRITKILSIPAITLLLFTACNEFIEPEKIYDENKTLNSGPQITSILPSDSAVAGVREIIINGSGFAVNSTDTNWVFVGGEPALIKSISENQIVFYRPAKAGNDLTISVVIPSAEGFGKKEHYKVGQAISNWGDLQFLPNKIMAIEVGNDESLFIATQTKLYKLDPDGIILTEIVTFKGADFLKFTDIKFGPDGYLYACTDKDKVFQIDPVTGDQTTYIDLNQRTTRLDFDQSGNLYAAKRKGVFIVTPSKTVTATNVMSGTEIVEMRVYNGSLYLATSKQIVKYSIQDGALVNEQQVTDLNTVAGFSNCSISSFNINSEGIILLCLSSHPAYSLFVLENNGAITPYYYAEKIIPRGIDQIVYGNDKFLYLNRGITVAASDSVRLFKMGMDKAGAPYLGR